MILSTFSLMIWNQILERMNDFVFMIPWCPLCSIMIARFLRFLRITIRFPRSKMLSECTTSSSIDFKEYWVPICQCLHWLQLVDFMPLSLSGKLDCSLDCFVHESGWLYFIKCHCLWYRWLKYKVYVVLCNIFLMARWDASLSMVA